MSDLTPAQKKEINDAAHSVWAEMKTVLADREAQIEKLGGEVGETAQQIERMEKALDERIDQLETKSNRPQVTEREQQLGEARAAFDALLRKGDIAPELAKALATDVDSEGGYLVPENVRDGIIEKIVEVSPLRQVANVETITVGNQLKVPVENGVFAASWTTERASRSETTAGTFAQENIPVHELYAKPLATQSMLDDAGYDIEGWITRKLGEQFGKAEAAAFISATGVGRPQGVLNGGLASVESDASGVLDADDVLDLIYDLAAPYAVNGVLLWHRTTTRTLRKERSTATGDFLWSPGIDGSTAPTFAGHRYLEAIDIPEIASGAVAAVFADFAKLYTIVDRKGISTLRDPFSSKPHVEFYTTRRVGGQVVLPEAGRVLTVKA